MFRHKYTLEALLVTFLHRFLRLCGSLLLFRILALVAVLVRVIILAHYTSRWVRLTAMSIVLPDRV
jgi:hypothetical protein